RRAWRTGRYIFPLPTEGQHAPAVQGPDLLRSLRSAGVVTDLMGTEQAADPAFAEGWDRVHTSPHAPMANKSAELLVAELDHLSATGKWLLWLDDPSLLPPWQPPTRVAARYLKRRGQEGK